jgi:hypothetical protein
MTLQVSSYAQIQILEVGRRAFESWAQNIEFEVSPCGRQPVELAREQMGIALNPRGGLVQEPSVYGHVHQRWSRMHGNVRSHTSSTVDIQSPLLPASLRVPLPPASFRMM